MKRVGVGDFRAHLREYVKAQEVTVLINEQTEQEIAVIMPIRMFEALVAKTNAK